MNLKIIDTEDRNMANVLHLSGKREVFWDDYLLDTDKTTATHRVHQPKEAGVAMVHDTPWEGNASDFHNIVVDPDGLYRMYYLGWNVDFPHPDGAKFSPINLCYAESRDGITWTRPALDICDWDGMENNVLIDGRSQAKSIDGFRVFRDDNPACPPEERYKGISRVDKEGGGQELWCFVSEDGIHFKKGWFMTDKGWFDSLNNPMWDAERGIYHCFVRHFHNEIPKPGEEINFDRAIRDIRYMWSKDFREWSEPVLLDFMGKEDYPLYTNCVSVYDRAPQLFIGFPTRYIDRYDWSDNYERLCGSAARKTRMKCDPRLGTVITDCVFMFSRDAKTWCRYDEAFMRPGPEYADNWLYGDCYPAIGLVETPAPHGGDAELSLYSVISAWSETDTARLMRYTIRKDGFVSLNAPYDGATVTTKPFVFDGKGIKLNFSTSARGYLYVTLTAEDGTVAKSCEIFGDSCDRIIDFDTDLSAFAGKETVMEIKMRDADLYAVKFD